MNSIQIQIQRFQKKIMRQFFPFSEIREPQRRAIDFIVNSFKTSRFVILEAGTRMWKELAIGCNCVERNIYKVSIVSYIDQMN